MDRPPGGRGSFAWKPTGKRRSLSPSLSRSRGTRWRSSGKDMRMSRSSGIGACRSTTGKRSGTCLQRGSRMTLPEVIGAIHPLREAGGISDGAGVVGEAVGKGALAAIVSEAGARKVPGGLSGTKPVFVVRDPVEALCDMARAHRLRHRDIPLVGITGSSGKTTTKEMLFCLLSRFRRVLRNPGNRNNLIGMPLVLLELSGEHDAAILEMGSNAPGEIARLAGIACPDIAVITNIAPAHLEGFCTMEGLSLIHISEPTR